MIDYMWHHQQQTSTSVNAPTVANKANHFQFPPYSALNWIKQPPPFLFKPNGAAPASDEKPPAFNHFHSAFKPVINMRLNDDANANGASSMVNVNPSTQSPTSSTSSNYVASSTNLSDDEQLTPVKKPLNRKRMLKSKEVDYYVDVDENSSHGESKICINDDGFDGNTKDQMTSDDENEMVDIETTEDDIQILNLQPFKVSSHHNEVEHEEEIEVTDEKFAQLENNNNIKSFEHESCVKMLKQVKNPIKSLKEIVGRSENSEYYAMKRNHRASPHYQEWTLNLKKEVRSGKCFFSLSKQAEN